MKQDILNRIAKIKEVAEYTGIQGNVSIEFSGEVIPVSEWDSMIESITEYPRYNHVLTVANKLTVSLLLN